MLSPLLLLRIAVQHNPGTLETLELVSHAVIGEPITHAAKAMGEPIGDVGKRAPRNPLVAHWAAGSPVAPCACTQRSAK